jgi:hypothetical protein
VADDGLETLVELPAWQQDTPAAAVADETDVRADADNVPFIAAARVLFPQADYIANVHFNKHQTKL